MTQLQLDISLYNIGDVVKRVIMTHWGLGRHTETSYAGVIIDKHPDFDNWDNKECYKYKIRYFDFNECSDEWEYNLHAI
jgi:heat shock protein HspQ